MKKYNYYKDSEIEWIGEIPTDWDCVPLKYLSNVQNGSTPSSSEDSYWNGDINWVTTDDLGKLKGKFITQTKRTLTKEGYESCGTSIAPKGAVVVSTRAPIGHLGILAIDACTNQGCKTLVPHKIDSEFVYYCLLAAKPYLESLGEGSTFKELPTPKLKAFNMPYPPTEHQNIISAYLNSKTSQIDKLVLDKEKLVGLLIEERAVIINQAVTKGLDLSVPMKDSGFEWFGEIPEHWELKKIKHVNKKIGSGVTPKGGAEVYQDSGIPLLRSQNIYFDGLRLDDVAFISKAIHDSMSNSKVYPSDVLLNITGGSIGRCFYISTELTEANVNQHVCIIRPNEKILTVYLYNILRSNIGQLQIDICQAGGNRESLNFEQLKNFVIPLPNIVEQREILAYISAREIFFNDLIFKTKSEIELLNEYKKALISEVVTGKVDVRNEVIAESLLTA
jgi:type I restriction enzyme S subunit